jgi:tetraacyldisaccharide 4'-kinase
MKAVSAIWSGLSQGARMASQRGWISQTHLDARVISVGNIQAGGAGKTPLVAKISQEAIERGLRVCILCRGYRGQWEKSGGVLLPESGPAEGQLCGDEAALLHDLSPLATIGVGANRIRQFEEAKKQRGAPFDLVILDDGFQHWKIHKDLEVVALTSTFWGDSYFRDFPQALQHADLLVWTKGGTRPPSLGKPMVRVQYYLPPLHLQSPVWLITGIADGSSAATLASRSGISIQKQIHFTDHAHYQGDQIRTLMRQARETGCQIALTGKDWVKWRGFGIAREAVVVLEPELKLEEGKELWTTRLWGK